MYQARPHSVTRFNPTTNGPLHVGHAYTALLNQYLAVSTRGKFLVRFDDNQRYWWQKIGWYRMQEIAQEQLEDLTWLGIVPDEVTYQSKAESKVMEFLATSKWQPVIDHWPCSELRPIVVSDVLFEPGGLASYIVAEKVILDNQEGVTAIVRGMEFISDYNLERYLGALFGFKPPDCLYVPRLMDSNGAELSEISKTKGNWKIRDLRERGFEAEQVLAELRVACLIDPYGEWDLGNVKFRPALAREGYVSKTK